jgi:hypothetical protein
MARLLERHVVTGTLYCCRSFNGRTVDEMDYYNIDDLRRLVSNGRELGCHTPSHILASRHSRADILRDIEENSTYITPDLPGDAVERLFALGFTLEQLRRNFEHLKHCAKTMRNQSWARTGSAEISLFIALSHYGGEFFAARINAACRARSVYQKKHALSKLPHGPKFGVDFTEDMVTISDEQNARATHL